jgi:tartrate-resistant acid phosphatase type 5
MLTRVDLKRILTGLTGLILLMTACAVPGPSPTPIFATATIVPLIDTAQPTDTLLPTNTPLPTETPLPTRTPLPTETLAPTLTPQPQVIKFAVLGDYGSDNTAEAEVAALIHSWEPDLIITTGDNNYPSGAADTIDDNIGKYFHDYIYPYVGTYGSGADQNRYFPSLGNHDWMPAGAQPYMDYFTLPGNERYYDFAWGPVHFFSIDSDFREPDGVGSSSVQGAWLKQGLAASTSPWNIVYMHHPPYSSGYHGSSDWMQKPFAAWGADALMAGHDHLYERLLVDGIPYFTSGAGGGGLYDFNDPLPESQFRYNANYGAMLVTVGETEMLFEFYNRTGELIDSYRVTKP